MESSSAPEDFSDDITKLETKVVYAMLRLEKSDKPHSNSRGKFSGVTSHQIVEYLNENHRYLDGDIESQVITALLSCVKNGVVCAQDDGKYRLVGPNPKMMMSNCVTRSTHGSRCSCLNMINFMSKVNPNNCCTLKMNGGRVAKKGLKAMMKRKSAVMETSRTSSRLGKKKKRKRKIKRVRCIQKVRESLSNDKIDKVEDIKSKKCKYCQRYHVKKSQTTFCKKCYPPGIQFVVPFDKFSPREEVCEVFTYSL